MGWHSHQSGVISITDQLIFQYGKKLRSRNNNGPKTLPCRTLDTTVPSLLWRSSTITWCYRSDHTTCQYRQLTQNLQFPQSRANSEWSDGCHYQRLHWDHFALSSLCTLLFTLKHMGQAQKCITGTLTYLILKIGWLEVHHLRSINRICRTNTRHSYIHFRKYAGVQDPYVRVHDLHIDAIKTLCKYHYFYFLQDY